MKMMTEEEIKIWRENQNYEIGHRGWTVVHGKWYQVEVVDREYYPITGNFRRHIVKVLEYNYKCKRITLYTRKQKEE